MNIVNQLKLKLAQYGVLISHLFFASAAFAANGDIKFVQGVKNVGSLGEASGSALYTWVLVAGLALLVLSVAGWFWSSNPDVNAGKGFNRFLIVGAVAGTVLTFAGAFLGASGELIGISDANETINYRSLSSQANN